MGGEEEENHEGKRGSETCPYPMPERKEENLSADATVHVAVPPPLARPMLPRSKAYSNRNQETRNRSPSKKKKMP